ncbi:MAG: excinuclease ABC subunit C [Micavibrio aeruginosavorus]|uniref:UvrABC system protein C n=1 Tax=Micavibrio aeruginosavorus TaxID=349221 RepID=A0A2W5MYC8_9BACT|nr:MAG: excinuclease ABC subunit C [Micavibrio aeruginosavorus]
MGSNSFPNSLERGATLIRDYVKTLPEKPGVYRMLNEKGDVLYVGKARALKKRVVTYSHVQKLPNRLKRMVSETASMEFITTNSEVEALLLESNLIKKLQPRFNILLRDDKSFPYILLTSDHDFPQVKKHRGARKPGGEYFGPFASAGAVNQTIDLLQRIFKLRNCTDSYFAARKRPCLQYHIKRCTAPCVGRISVQEYAQSVEQARAFLTGKSRALQDDFRARMEEASESMDYELAAEYRDKIHALSSVQAHQDINIEGLKDIDVIAFYQREGKTCIQAFFFRGGQNFGNRAYFPRHDSEVSPATIMANFLAQFYEGKPIPPEIIVGQMPAERALIEEALAAREKSGRKVSISMPVRGARRRLLDFVEQNAKGALERHLLERKGESELLEGVAKLFSMEGAPERIEIYDNSHISGTNMVGGMVVAGAEGFRKGAYRKFNIRIADKGDDYGMMREVMTRRFGRAIKEEVDKESDDWPDLLLIDGGLGQFNAVREVLTELGVWEDMTVVSIAKGPDRNAGREQFFMEGREPFQLPVNDAVLHYLQRLRDEAHRFAIGAHRKRRSMEIGKNPLDEIAGIGAARKKALLHHFGSAKAIKSAGVEDLLKVEGISRAQAEKIFAFFNE